jgi:tripartite-type tricarboxylate transporter receptor subunit TctC
MKVTSFLLMALTMLCAGTAAAQNDAGYPARTMKIVVNVTPGGGVDTATRIIAQKLGEKFGQTIVVENRGGGSGNIAAEAVFHADPDGYTLLAAPGATISINDLLFKRLGFDPVKFEPVSVLTSVPLALVVRPGFPAKTFQELLAYAKANPGKLNYASNGIGTAAHLTAELFNMETGAKMVHVPYKGTNPVLNDLVADHVDLTFIQYSAFLDLHKAGKVRILAVANPKRVAAMPDVPTLAEMGFPELISNTWNVLAAPPKTPPAVLTKLNRAIDEILANKDTTARFAAMETTVEGGSLDAAKKYVEADRERWKKVIAAGGIEAE